MTIRRDKEADLKKLADEVMKRLYFDDSIEFGTPCIDPKRPFGFSHGIERQIMEIIGMKPVNEETNPSKFEEQQRYARELYRDELVPYIQRRWQELH